MIPVFVGESNPYGAGDPQERLALYPLPIGSAGHRLQSLILGIRRADYVGMPRYNLCRGKWSVPEARLRATTIPPRHPGSPIVLLGAKVRAAFNVQAEPFTVAHGHGLVFVVLPHPSGLSRAWNEPGTYERARALLREVSPEIRWGETGGPIRGSEAIR